MTTAMGSLRGTAYETVNDNRDERGCMQPHSNRGRRESYMGRSTALDKAGSVSVVGVEEEEEAVVGRDDDDDAAGDDDDWEMGQSLSSKLAHWSGAAGAPTVMKRGLAAAWTLFHWQQSVQRAGAAGRNGGVMNDDVDDGAVTEAKAEMTEEVAAAAVRE